MDKNIVSPFLTHGVYAYVIPYKERNIPVLQIESVNIWHSYC